MNLTTMYKLYISCTLWQQRIKYNIIIYARECMEIRDIIVSRKG